MGGAMSEFIFVLYLYVGGLAFGISMKSLSKYIGYFPIREVCNPTRDKPKIVHDSHLDLTFVCHFVVHLDIHIFTHYFSKEIEGARGCNQIKTLEYVTTFHQ